jgi:phage terminase small subunit
MPRKTAAALQLIGTQSQPTRVKPPSTLSQVERTAFLEVVNNSAPQHFQPSDVLLLSRYAESIVLAERAAKELRGEAVVNGKVSPWLVVHEKALRAIVALSMRLRLSPQGRRPNNPLPKLITPASAYETIDDDDE